MATWKCGQFSCSNLTMKHALWSQSDMINFRFQFQLLQNGFAFHQWSESALGFQSLKNFAFSITTDEYLRLVFSKRRRKQHQQRANRKSTKKKLRVLLENYLFINRKATKDYRFVCRPSIFGVWFQKMRCDTNQSAPFPPICPVFHL